MSCGFVFFFYAYLVQLVTLAILFMQISLEDTFCKMELDSSIFISSFLFSGETEAEELTTKCFHYPSECFQPEGITLTGEGKKSRCSWHGLLLLAELCVEALFIALTF